MTSLPKRAWILAKQSFTRVGDMRTLFTLLGELVEALVKHYQQDDECAQLVTEIADYIIPGEPFAQALNAQPEAQARQGGLVDFSKGA
jgi:hypothetical protein